MKVDVIILFNGLGNQMSQYAFYIQKKSINPKNTYIINFCNNDHNSYELYNIFGIRIERNFKTLILYCIFRILLTEKFAPFSKALKKILNALRIIIIKENFDYRFKENYLIPKHGIRYFYGGWHHPSYFESVNDIVLKSFQFPQQTDKELNDIIALMNNVNSVGLHVRRGDFYNQDNINLFGGVCDVRYFEKSIEYISKEIKDPHFFIFSNDHNWVKKNIKLQNCTYVTINFGKNSWRDMYLMSLCNHNIISNSTFSWWAAWLNRNSKKIIISPDRFILPDPESDIFPKTWHKI